MKKFFSLIALLLFSFWLGAQDLSSPNGEFELYFEIDEGVPTYRLNLDDKPVIKRSKLGLELKYTESLLDNFKVKSILNFFLIFQNF